MCHPRGLALTEPWAAHKHKNGRKGSAGADGNWAWQTRPSEEELWALTLSSKGRQAPHITSLCSCFDSLMTYRDREGVQYRVRGSNNPRPSLLGCAS